MPLFFLGTREWRNRQTRTVQVRVPVMEWGFNSPLAHNETADPSGSAVLFSLVVAAVSLVAPRVFRAPEGPAAVCAGGRRPARVMVLLVAPRVFRAPEVPAAREARASLRSAPRLEARPCPPVPPAPYTPVGPGVLIGGSARRLEARPGPAAAHRHRGRSLRCPSHLWGLVADVCLSFAPRSPARPRHRPSISHVIPLRLVQTLNLCRRNCNIFGVSRKMTAINYVRNVGGGGVVAAHGCRSQVLPLLVGVTGAWCAWFLGCFGACCYKRRQSIGFFGENGGFWA